MQDNPRAGRGAGVVTDDTHRVPGALLVTSSFLPGRGGIESLLAELCERLSPRLAVLAPAVRNGQSLPTGLGYPVAGCPASMLIPGPRVVTCIVEAAAAQATDRVLFGTPWPLALLGPRLRDRGLRYGIIVHGAETLVPAATPVVRRRITRALALAEMLFPVSKYTQAMLESLIWRSGYAIPPTHLLRARVDLERFSPAADGTAARARLGVGRETKLILSLGRLVSRKGVHRLIESLSVIRARVPDAVIVVAGTGPEDARLRKLARAERAPVIFTGRVADEHAPALYASADVFALPVADRWMGLEVEGLGVVLLEAAACAVPCVAGDSGGTPEAVVDGVTGYVVDARDGRQLARAITTILTDPGLARRLGRAGRDHVEREFGHRSTPQQLLDWLA